MGFVQSLSQDFFGQSCCRLSQGFDRGAKYMGFGLVGLVTEARALARTFAGCSRCITNLHIHPPNIRLLLLTYSLVISMILERKSGEAGQQGLA